MPRHDMHDRFYKVRLILMAFNQRLLEAYHPGKKNISVDEGMIAFKGRLSFRQYMPAKPTKYGIKVWMAADAANGFVLASKVYFGRERDGNALQHGLDYDVVTSIYLPFFGKNHHVYFDNFFSLPKLLEDLLTEKMYVCSTIRVNRQGLPTCSSRELKKGEVLPSV